MAGSSADAESALSVDIGKRFPDGTEIEAQFVLGSKPPLTWVLFGPSGAGKTTILRCIAGLETLTRGRIAYGEETWSDGRHGNRVSPQRRRVGYVFQDFALFPHLTVRANVGFGLQSVPRIERDRRVDAVCARLGMEGFLNHRPRELSGGQQQRVALARVLVCEPRVLLLDEPFAALDAGTRDQVRSYLQSLLASLGIPALVVTHDWVDALTLGDQMMVLGRGQLLQTGPPREVLTRPSGKEAASAVGVETVAEGRILTREGGVARLAVGESELTVVDPGGEGSRFWVCIRGEDVTLEHGIAQRSSARNHLDGRIRDVIPQGALTKVVLDVGFELVALVTRQAADDLSLTPGEEISAVFKASVVHLIPRSAS